MKTVLKLHPGISFCGRLCVLPQPVVLPSLPHLSCHACRSSLLFPASSPAQPTQGLCLHNRGEVEVLVASDVTGADSAPGRLLLPGRHLQLLWIS